jgi:diadenosine tetraphosphate (Ap4A) HIT family hydrolase
MANENCLFCDPTSDTYKWQLYESDKFRVICDGHPLTEGHLLIVPKDHISCVGAFSEETLMEFRQIYNMFSAFISRTYKSLSTFEHGVFGQTVFHSHVHILPFSGGAHQIIPEGTGYLKPLNEFAILSDELHANKGYLFFSIGQPKWLVDVSIAEPRFFRDRFASALGRPELADWKSVHNNAAIMSQFSSRNDNTIRLWRKYD